MNERIKELSEQAGFYYTDKTGFITPAGCNPAKFAELIVRECVEVSINNGCGDFVDIKQKLFEHFGVEE